MARNQNNLDNVYFDWMYHLVCDDSYYNKVTYRRLLHYLHETEFIFIIDRDENRAIDGVDFRYRFGYECGYSREAIERYLDTRPCSVLEMMVALAFGIEEDIMDDPEYGNRTGQWFWSMIVSLGLGSMTDLKFNANYVDEVIQRFLNRDYQPNGQGGIFTVQNPRRDMRTVEIWYQAMWYLNEILEN